MVVIQHILRVIIHATKCKAGYSSDVYFSVWYLFPWKPLQNPTVFFIIGYEGFFQLSRKYSEFGSCNWNVQSHLPALEVITDVCSGGVQGLNTPL